MANVDRGNFWLPAAGSFLGVVAGFLVVDLLLMPALKGLLGRLLGVQ